MSEEQRATLERLMLMIEDGTRISVMTKHSIKAYAETLVSQAMEKGAALQRMTDAGQEIDNAIAASDLNSELALARSVAKSHHDDLVAARRMNAELLKTSQALLKLADEWQVGQSIRDAARTAIARAEAAQKGKT